MSKLTFLDVPFDQKDEVKALGAKWHSKQRKWFVPEEVDSSLFVQWVPQYDTEFNIRTKAPFYLIESFEVCYRCQSNAPVITFGAAGSDDLIESSPASDENSDCNDEEPVSFSYISVIPGRLAAFIEKNYPTYFIDWSNTTESYYFMNHCDKCNARLGDFFLHSEPDHAFFPQTPEDVNHMKVTNLKSTGGVTLNASVHYGSMAYILEHTTVQPFDHGS